MRQIDEPVELSLPRSDWAQRFAAEREQLRRRFPEEVDIEPIGSTAVPGMVAKPVIDIMVGGSELPSGGEHPAIGSFGYEPLGEAGVPGRFYFRKREPKPFNLYLVVKDGVHWLHNGND